ncbi:MAG: hypothetical protein B6D55_00800 [Candidatus Omnitrophica bacterium 4484_70.2]|nr:MAG: hypothetical protein B6D55_00800 [Candidatus Omnitrophica bacterium 4484_70.2]
MKVIFFAIIKLLLIIFLGFFLYRKKILTQEALKFLTFFVVNITVPFLIFTEIIAHLNPENSPPLYKFVLLSIFIFSLGSFLGIIFSPFSKFSKEFIALVSFQNCGYLPMNLALFLFSSPLRDTFLIYIFLYILGFNILMWSVGSFLIFKKKKEEFKMRSLFTMPIVSIIISLLCVYLKINRFFPDLIISPLALVGKMSFPLSMILLGAWLAKGEKLGSREALLASFIKLFLFPLIFFILILRFKLFSLWGFFILIQASMPSAASLPIVAQMRGGKSEVVSCGVFLSHVLALFTVPVWLFLFSQISGFKF